MERDAALSECGRYRYRLGRKWGPGPYLLYVMLNPSTADAEEDDPTIRRCVGFSTAHGYGALHVVNLYAYRATDPRDLKVAGYPVGPDNDNHIKAALVGADAVCVAWGDRARGLSRPAEVLSMIARAGRATGCLAVTKHGLPSHPLMLAATCRLSEYGKTPNVEVSGDQRRNQCSRSEQSRPAGGRPLDRRVRCGAERAGVRTLLR